MTSDAYLQSSIIASSFQAFDPQHLAVLGLILFLAILAHAAARSSNSSLRRWVGHLLGMLLLGQAAAVYIRQGMVHVLSWKYSLPLELCYLVLIACFFSLFRPRPWLIEIAYYWGLGGVLQAVLTPELTEGFPSWDFLLFFWGHGVTLLAIIFLISAPEFMPRRGAVLRMMLAINLYALIVGAIDAIAGWNYGYLCRKPLMPSLLDYLGPWPWYLLSLEGIALMMFLLFDLPWRLLLWRRDKNERLKGTP